MTRDIIDLAVAVIVAILIMFGLTGWDGMNGY